MKSTFIVNFAVDPVEAFRGRVEHVGTGEALVFSSPEKLFDFFEKMSTSGSFDRAGLSFYECPENKEK